MADTRAVVFVEVRYRADDRWGDGLASITRSKQKRLINAARSWLARHPEHATLPCRFDVVAITGQPDAPSLRWVRSAFGS